MFEKFQHVCRYGTGETNGILEGKCAIFPKPDGTNASIWFDSENETICFGSRKRQLDLDDDNAGFVAAMSQPDMQEKLLQLFKIEPNWRLFGEWLVPHTIKDYRDDVWRRFWVFNVMDGGTYVPYTEYRPVLVNLGIDSLPGEPVENPTLEYILENKNRISQWGLSDQSIADGKLGEGIVVHNYDFVNRYGRITWAKFVNETFGNAKKGSKPKTATESVIEYQIVNHIATDDVIAKEMAKINNKYVEDGFEMKRMPELIEMVYRTILEDEFYDTLKHFKFPDVSFKKLRGAVAAGIRSYIDRA